MRHILQTLKNLNLTCRGAARLLSERCERPLGRSERIGLRLHLLICKSCRGYARGLNFLRRLMSLSPVAPPADDAVLPADARERIRKVISDR